MKIKITYQQGEPVTEVLQALSPLFPGKKWKFSDHHAPYFHAYLTVTPQTEKVAKSSDFVDYTPYL
ncbi:MAG: hypothetical protein Q4D42_10680 [Eubacteriales bacterium]|nr:hypothetical protein [Eubacteriales bacterium]